MLACLPQGPVHIKLRDHTVDDGRRDGEDDEGSEEPALEVGERVAELEEGEAVEYAHDDGDEQLAVDVRRVAPLLHEGPLGEFQGLE